MSRTGRRPGDGDTRAAIADAARRQFGRRGYGATTIRSVAEEAGVDPALVMHFFGSKEQLLSASVQWPFDPVVALAAVVADGPAVAGERLVRLLVQTWGQEAGRNPIVTLLRAAMSQEAIERQLREFLERELLLPLVSALGCDHARLRANLVAAQLVGLGIARHVLRFEPLAGLDDERVVEPVGASVQASLTAPLPGGG